MASIPSTQKGIIIEKTGGVEVLQYKTDLPVPTPNEGEILVKNDFIGINYIDTFVHLSLSNFCFNIYLDTSAPVSIPLPNPKS